MRKRVRPPWWRLVDWRVVAVFGLPIWAAAGGVAVGYKARPVAELRPAEPPEFVGPPAPPAESGPGGPLLWYHLAAAATPNAASPRPDPQMLALMAIDARARRAETTATEAHRIATPRKKSAGPPDEIDGCKTFQTYVAWRPSPTDAMKRAAADEKLVFVLHLAGNIEDDGFT